MNSLKIDQTQAYKALPQLSQQMAMKRVNRIQIEEEIIICRNVGIEVWKNQTPLQKRWKTIVVEIINFEKNAKDNSGL